MLQFRRPVGNTAQRHQRHGIGLRRAHHRERLHVHHVGVDRVIGAAGDHACARGQGRRLDARNDEGQRHIGRQVQKRRHALLESQRRRIHVPIGDRDRLIDFRLFERARTGRAQRDHEIGQASRCGAFPERF